MRRIAIINQKGGVGKTTTATNLGAALAREGKRVVVVDMDPQANLSLYLGCEARSGDPTIYGVLVGGLALQEALRSTSTKGLWLIPSHIDLSGAELELAATIGRETVLREALDSWESAGAEVTDRRGVAGPVDYLILDCPPSLGLLSINALAAAYEVLISVQTEFFALQGLGKLVEVVQLMQRRLNPRLLLTGLLPNLYDNRLRLAREVLAELRRFFPGKVYSSSIRANVKLAESPSHSRTIFEYAPDSNGAKDYSSLAQEVMLQEEEFATPPEQPTPSSQELLEAANALREAEKAKLSLTQADPIEEEQYQEPAVEPAPQAPASEAVAVLTEPSAIEVATLEPPAELECQEEEGTLEVEPEHEDKDQIAASPPQTEEPEPAPSPLARMQRLFSPDEPLPFGVIVPPGPNSRVEFRTAHEEPSLTVDEEQAEPAPETALLENEPELAEPELDEQPATESLPVYELESTSEPESDAPEPEEETAPAQQAVRALPVYDFGTYIGEDRYRLPGPSGPARPRV